MFALPKTTAELVSVTNRAEKHGEEEVPAVSIGLKIDGPNTLLDSLSPTLRSTLYTTLPGQPESLPGVEPSTPKLRTEGIESVHGAGKLEGWTVVIDHGIDDETAVVLKACKLDKWRVEPKEGGQVVFAFRVGTSAVDARIMGLLGIKIGQKVAVTIMPPEMSGVGEPTAAKHAKPKASDDAAGQIRIDADASAPRPFGDKGDKNRPATDLTPEQALADSVGEQ